MFVGRNYERELVKKHLGDHSKAQLLVLYGRRRVGKSTLIRESLKNEKKVLFFEGIEGEPTNIQIDQFLKDLSRQTGRIRLAARNWRDVFQGLGEIISRGRWVLVFDEFPWMAAGRSRIVSDLKVYWDRWAQQNRQLALFLCGSVASFMTQHLIHSKALHNRKTLELCLNPLSPGESGLFIKNRSLWEKAELYMCLGGIPKYLEQINPKLSLAKNLNHHCFSYGGFFINEYETLFKEQFRAIGTYQSIIACLAKGPASLSDISRKTGLPKGGGLSGHLVNLIRSQFIREYSPHTTSLRKRSRTKIYKLTDPFLLFYFHYIYPNLEIIQKNKGYDLFHSLVAPSLPVYYGLAFERLCEDAMNEILLHLNIHLSDILTIGPFFQQRTPVNEGLQIDNLIMRRDKVWTIMEYKYHQKPIGMEVVHDVTRKIERLKVPAQISVEKVLVTSAGATSNVKRSGFFDSILTMKELVDTGKE